MVFSCKTAEFNCGVDSDTVRWLVERGAKVDVRDDRGTRSRTYTYIQIHIHTHVHTYTIHIHTPSHTFNVCPSKTTETN